jgi:hypothetical protein
VLGSLLQPSLHHVPLTRKIVFSEEAVIQLTLRRVPVHIAQLRELLLFLLLTRSCVRVVVRLEDNAEKLPSVSLLLAQSELLDLLPLPLSSSTAKSRDRSSLGPARALESAEMSLLAPLRPQLLANFPPVSFLEVLDSHIRNSLELQHQIMRGIVLVLRSRQVVEEAVQSLSEDFDLFADAICDVAQRFRGILRSASGGAGGGREIHVARLCGRCAVRGSNVLVVVV